MQISDKEIDSSITAEVAASNRYWTPVRNGDFGEYGPHEMRLAAAAYFNLGDIGDDIWQAQRTLPFDDYALEQFYIGNDALVFFTYEDNPIFRFDKPLKTGENYKQDDPAVLWALQEQTKLLDCQKGRDLTAEEINRLDLLTQFVIEAEQWNVSMRESDVEFDAIRVRVPDWAFDTVSRNVDGALEYDPQIMEDREPSGSLRASVLSVAPMPKASEIEVFHDVHKIVTIDTRDLPPARAFAVVNGERTMVDQGPRTSAIQIHVSPPGETAWNAKNERDEAFLAILHQYGFGLRGEPGAEEPFLKSSFASLAAAEACYDQFATQVANLHGWYNTIMGVYENKKKTLALEAYREIGKKMSIRRKIGGQMKSMGLAVYIQQQTGSHFYDVTPETAADYLTEAEINYLSNRIDQAVSSDTWILQVRKQWGYETVTVTHDKELADEWNHARAEDIPYFLASPTLRREHPRPSSFLPETMAYMKTEDTQPYLDAYAQSLMFWTSAEACSLGRDSLESLMANFNAGRKVKFLASRISRDSGWLLNELPVKASQLAILEKAQACIVREIIEIRSTDRLNKIIMSKLQLAARTAIQSLAGTTVHPDLLKKLRSGVADIYYEISLMPKPTDPRLLSMYTDMGFIHSYERSPEIDHFVSVKMSFNKVCDPGIDVLQIMKSFRFNEANMRIIASL